jgi:hypothetical protein
MENPGPLAASCAAESSSAELRCRNPSCRLLFLSDCRHVFISDENDDKKPRRQDIGAFFEKSFLESPKSEEKMLENT